MDAKQVMMVKAHLIENDTAELLEIWNANDRKSYTDEAFEAIRLILTERGVPVPQQPIYVPIKEKVNRRSKDNKELDKTSETKRKPQTESGQHLEKAYTYKESNKFEDALREADAAIKLDPALAEAHNLRGMALEELGREAEAIEAYRQAIVLNPDFCEAKNNLSDLEARPHLEQAYIYKEADKFDEMLREADAAIKVAPSLAEAHNLRGMALEELGSESEAIKAYKQAIALNPKFREAKNNLSDLLAYLSENHKLDPDEKYEIDPNDKYKLVTVATFTHPIEANIAKSILDREGIWAFIAGENFNRLYPLAECGLELRVKQPDAARAIELLNEKPDGTKALQEELGHPDEALKSYKQTINLDPTFREAKKNLVYLESDLTEKNQPVPITESRNPIEANISKDILDSEGIPSFVLHGQLCVRGPDEEKARELLSGKPDISEPLDNEPVEERPWPLSLLQSPFTRHEKRKRIPPSKKRK